MRSKPRNKTIKRKRGEKGGKTSVTTGKRYIGHVLSRLKKKGFFNLGGLQKTTCRGDDRPRKSRKKKKGKREVLEGGGERISPSTGEKSKETLWAAKKAFTGRPRSLSPHPCRKKNRDP